MPLATTRLLIVDDHCLYCAGVRMLFHGVWFVEEVATANQPCQAIEVARRFQPHVTLMDVTLPHPGPFELAREIISLQSDNRIIFLDDTFCQIRLRRAREVGASGYMTKHATFEEMSEAVRCIAAGQTKFLSMPHRHADKPYSGPHFNRSSSESLIDRLSTSELEVIRYLCKGLATKECAEQMGLSCSAIDNRKAQIMKKLGVDNVIQLAILACREGLLHQ